MEDSRFDPLVVATMNLDTKERRSTGAEDSLEQPVLETVLSVSPVGSAQTWEWGPPTTQHGSQTLCFKGLVTWSGTCWASRDQTVSQGSAPVHPSYKTRVALGT
jgi:hypothetical protein